MTINELGNNFEWPNIFRTIVPKKDRKRGTKRKKICLKNNGGNI